MSETIETMLLGGICMIIMQTIGIMGSVMFIDGWFGGVVGGTISYMVIMYVAVVW